MKQVGRLGDSRYEASPGMAVGRQGREEKVKEVCVRLSLAEFSEPRKYLHLLFTRFGPRRSTGGFWDQECADRRLLVISKQCLLYSRNIYAVALLAVL